LAITITHLTPTLSSTEERGKIHPNPPLLKEGVFLSLKKGGWEGFIKYLILNYLLTKPNLILIISPSTWLRVNILKCL